MKGLSDNIWRTVLSLLLLFISGQGVSGEPERGVAVEPMEIIVKDSRMFYFSVYNDTDTEYIIMAQVVRENGEGNTPFALNPPLRHLNKRDNVKMGLIYLPKKKEDNRDNIYYLSVSFIPRQHKSAGEKDVVVPLVLVQQIPVVVE